jgi:hypothetical protein
MLLVILLEFPAGNPPTGTKLQQLVMILGVQYDGCVGATKVYIGSRIQ